MMELLRPNRKNPAGCGGETAIWWAPLCKPVSKLIYDGNTKYYKTPDSSSAVLLTLLIYSGRHENLFSIFHLHLYVFLIIVLFVTILHP